MTDIDLTMMPGSTAEDVHEKVIPPSWHSARDDPALGCWRSHANVWRKIISENIATALVLEDDADWDVNVKEQMFLQSQAILSHPNLVTNDSRVEDEKPYRDDWDIFFLGACQLRAYGNETSEAGPFIVVKDAYMAQRDKLRDSYLNALDHFGTLCTTGYAVSKKGAARLLYNIGWKDFAFPIDNELSWKIEKGIIRGITTSPPIFNMYKTHSSRDSDINNTTKNEQASNADGSTADIRNSARMAMNNYYAPDTPPEEYWAPRLNIEPVKVGDA
ncbi:hypothetical protein FKW77_000707 [Venturia effusa]|uniref:Glycosyl transferase family 25 domain-containing protein n=1 Tax=Venturia effusa TaxID=50376 RepID=A0A517LBU1_9PEZI|nr:hypothetical protein FKW77_000707 [Venturia effusa]